MGWLSHSFAPPSSPDNSLFSCGRGHIFKQGKSTNKYFPAVCCNRKLGNHPSWSALKVSLDKELTDQKQTKHCQKNGVFQKVPEF